MINVWTGILLSDKLLRLKWLSDVIELARKRNISVSYKPKHKMYLCITTTIVIILIIILKNWHRTLSFMLPASIHGVWEFHQEMLMRWCRCCCCDGVDQCVVFYFTPLLHWPIGGGCVVNIDQWEAGSDYELWTFGDVSLTNIWTIFKVPTAQGQFLSNLY